MNIREQVDRVNARTLSARRQRASLVGLLSLILGDALVFLIFAAIGRRSHGEAAGLDSLLQVALTAAPFAAAWFLVSPWFGAFRRTVVTQPKAMVARTALAWLTAWPLAMALRGFVVDRAIPPLTFAVITLVSNTILLLLWRAPLALLVKQRRRSELV
ncbi:MAG: DUF3054 domain-containing protein [Chloroflexi bacterium]|nr:MAG: DUF3054 domain-containing protein [Chloroflexota bacterium]